MANYRIVLKPSIAKDIRGIPKPVVERIFDAIEKLGDDPLPNGVVKLEGADKTFRIRIGEFRVIYEFDSKRKVVDILYVRNRREAYKKK